MNIEKKETISISAIILSLSYWMMLFSKEGSFTIQSLVPFLILMVISILLKRKLLFKLKKNNVILGMFIVIIVFSTFINLYRYPSLASFDILLTLGYFIVIFVWYCLFTIDCFNSNEIKLCLKSYIAVSFVSSLLLIRQFLNKQTGKIYLINLVGQAIDENHISAYISVAAIFLFISLLNKKHTLKTKLLYLFIMGIEFFGVAISGSRAAFLSLILAIILAVLIYSIKEFNAKKMFSIIIGSFCLLIIGIKIINFLPTWTFDRYFNSNYMDDSNTHRLLYWKNGLKGISDQPLLGFGVGIFHNIDRYYINGLQPPARVPAHQTFIDIAIYGGLIGLFIFLLFLWKIFKPYLKGNKKIFLPSILVLLLVSNILGAEKTVFLWNNLIILSLISYYLDNKNNFVNDILL